MSSKYKDIISNSTQISSGPPAVYQLKTMKREFGHLTRMTFGETNVNKTNKTLLLVGETGTGKSTLINALINYSMGVKFEDKVWFQIVEDTNRSQTETQTTDVMVYEIFGFEGQTLPYSLTIIDTPGYGNTTTTEHDTNISQRLLDLFQSEDGVHEVNAVGLVMKTSECRHSDRLMYVFDSVMSLFGKDLEENIVALITHSNGGKPKNALQALQGANVRCARNEMKQPIHFLFNNFQHENQGDEAEDMEYNNVISERGMRQFTDFLENSEAQKLQKTIEVMNERTRLTACIQNLEERIKTTELKQTEIRETQKALQEHEEEMKKNEKFTIEVDEVYKDKIEITGGMCCVFYKGAVCCTVCEETCHHKGCTKAKSPKHCSVMKNGRCTVCTNKCPASDHVKEQWIYENKTRKFQRTEEEMKEKYEKNKTESEKKKSLLENLEEKMKELMEEESQLLDESYQHVVRLDQVALKVDSVSTRVHLDFLIEKMKETGDIEKVKKLEEMKR